MTKFIEDYPYFIMLGVLTMFPVVGALIIMTVIMTIISQSLMLGVLFSLFVGGAVIALPLKVLAEQLIKRLEPNKAAISITLIMLSVIVVSVLFIVRMWFTM